MTAHKDSTIGRDHGQKTSFYRKRYRTPYRMAAAFALIPAFAVAGISYTTYQLLADQPVTEAVLPEQDEDEVAKKEQVLGVQSNSQSASNTPGKRHQYRQQSVAGQQYAFDGEAIEPQTHEQPTSPQHSDVDTAIVHSQGLRNSNKPQTTPRTTATNNRQQPQFAGLDFGTAGLNNGFSRRLQADNPNDTATENTSNTGNDSSTVADISPDTDNGNTTASSSNTPIPHTPEQLSFNVQGLVNFLVNDLTLSLTDFTNLFSLGDFFKIKNADGSKSAISGTFAVDAEGHLVVANAGTGFENAQFAINIGNPAPPTNQNAPSTNAQTINASEVQLLVDVPVPGTLWLLIPGALAGFLARRRTVRAESALRNLVTNINR